MNALAQPIDAVPVAAPVGAESVALVEVISRAASDPNVNLEKLEGLMSLYERVQDRGAEQAFNEAMNQAQTELRPIAADANNPQTKSQYASYVALDRTIRPVYTRNGFALSFNTGDGAPAEHVRVLCYVAHRTGHTRTYHVDMPADGKGAKGGDVMTKTHAAGSAMSYGQRYLLKLIFNIAVGSDDDGNGAGGNGPGAAVYAATSAIEQCATLDALRAWKGNNAAVLAEMPTRDADAVVRAFNERMRALRSGAAQ